MPWYQIACNWSFNLVAADFFSMKSQTISISSFAPDSKPRESWKMKPLPSYVISCSISCSPLWHFNPISEHWAHQCTHWLASIDGIKWVSQGSSSLPRGTEYKKVHPSQWSFIQLTLLVMYNDRFCSLFYTTNLFKDGCLASIGSSYDKNAKMGTSVLIPEHCDILYMCSSKRPVNFIFWWTDNTNPPDAVAPAISAITNVSTGWTLVEHKNSLSRCLQQDESLEDKGYTGVAGARDIPSTRELKVWGDRSRQWLGISNLGLERWLCKGRNNVTVSGQVTMYWVLVIFVHHRDVTLN